MEYTITTITTIYYILFRMILVPYWCRELPSGRNCREDIFSHLKQAISVRKSSLSQHAEGEHMYMDSCLYVL